MLHMLSIALVLQLHDFAGVPPPVLHEAARELARVYDAIGVRVEWDHAAQHTGEGAALHVILVAREGGDLRRPRDSVMAATLWTASGTPVVYVFYRRVEAEAARYGVSAALVLACALAHEIGHVLMPERGHSREGLMRACWGHDDFHRANQGQLRFSADEAAIISERVQRTLNPEP
jgi:hypothetical protein